MNKSRLSIRVTDIKKINSISAWCAANLDKQEWEMTAVHLFKPDYQFHFICDKTRMEVILRHL